MKRHCPWVVLLLTAARLHAVGASSELNKEIRAALDATNYPHAVSLLSQVPEDDPNYARAMIVAGLDLLAEREDKPAAGVPLVEKAWRKFPDKQETTIALLRCELLAGTNLVHPLTARSHAGNVPDKFAFIAAGPKWPDHSQTFSRAELIEDLDYLEMLLANGYAYADRRGADWHGALDAVRASLGEKTGLDTFAWRLSRMFTLFGDMHSSIRHSLSDFIPKGRLPFLVEPQGERILAILPDRSEFLDKDFPFLESIDGHPLDEWLKVAALDVPKSSAQSQWAHKVQELRHINYLRAQLGFPAGTNVLVRLETADRSKHKDLTLEVPDQTPRVSGWPRTQTELRGNIGIVRLPEMADNEEFLKGLDETMAKFRQTDGLIIDVRQNGGGSQDALCTLLPYFMEPKAPMKIVNVAAYRIPARLDHVPAEGFLPAYRRLFPVTSENWNDQERRQIRNFLANFRPEWKLSPDFSDWHVMAISHATNPKAYYYQKPVVVLCDSGSFSATDNFLGALKGHPNVTIMGAPSGGGSGRMADYRLPNTRISLTLCQMASFRATGELYDGRGVKPDVVIETRLEDHLNNSDSVLDAALEKLQKRPK